MRALARKIPTAGARHRGLFNYFLIEHTEGSKLLCYQLVRAPLGSSWLDQVKQQYWCAGARWDVREERAHNFGNYKHARAAMLNLAREERGE